MSSIGCDLHLDWGRCDSPPTAACRKPSSHNTPAGVCLCITTDSQNFKYTFNPSQYLQLSIGPLWPFIHLLHYRRKLLSCHLLKQHQSCSEMFFSQKSSCHKKCYFNHTAVDTLYSSFLSNTNITFNICYVVRAQFHQIAGSTATGDTCRTWVSGLVESNGRCTSGR